MATRKYDAAMVHFGGYCLRRRFGHFNSIDERASACGTPIPLYFFTHHGMAVGTASLHAHQSNGSG